MKQDNSTELLGSPKFKTSGKSGPADPADPKSDFFYRPLGVVSIQLGVLAAWLGANKKCYGGLVSRYLLAPGGSRYVEGYGGPLSHIAT